MTTKRGRVLRDTSQGEGLVFVDGLQYPFRLETLWKSEFAPKANMPVDAEFDETGRLVGLRTVAGQGAGGEQAAQALAAAQETARKVAADIQARGLPAVAEVAARIGYPVLGALAAVVIGWFFLSAVVLDGGFLGKSSITFYQGLKLLNSSGFEALNAMGGGGSAGLYGFVAWLCLFAVFLPEVWKDPRASFGRLAPLAFMLLITIVAYSKLSSLGGGAEMRSAFSIGLGGWLAYAGAIGLAWIGWRGRAAAVAGQPVAG